METTCKTDEKRGRIVNVTANTCVRDLGQYVESFILAAAPGTDLSGVRPEDCLVFEDIVPGIRAGLAAGMQVCSVWDEAAADQQELKEALSHYSIRDFRDIVYA